MNWVRIGGLLCGVCIVVLSTGCAATRVNVTYKSAPEGADLYENGKFIGSCPYSCSYNITDDNRARGQINCREVVAQWPSGASESVSLRIPLNQGTVQEYTFRKSFNANARIAPRGGGEYSPPPRRQGSGDAYDSAYAEYIAAEREYKAAVDSLASARSQRSMNRMMAPGVLSQPNDGSWAQALGKTGVLLGSQDFGVNSAEAAVEKARVRLDRARARLQAVE